MPQDAAGAVVGRHDPPAPVQVDDAYPRVVEQGGHGCVPRFGADQRLPDADELPDMGQQPRDRRDPRRPPAVRVDGIAEAPDDGGPVRPVETRVHAVLAAGPEQHVVVGGRCLQLLGREQVLDVHETTVGQLPEARYAFVGGVVVFEVIALLVFPALPPAVGPDEEDPDVVRRSFADDEVIARDAADLVDEGRDARPAGIVEHGVVQRRQDALEPVLVAHDGPCLFFGHRDEPARKRPYGAPVHSVSGPRRPPSDTRFPTSSPSSPRIRWRAEGASVRAGRRHERLLLRHFRAILPLPNW